MSLKDDMQKDFAVFFNSDEYAEMHVVAGKQTACVFYEQIDNARGNHGEYPQAWQLQARKQDLPSVMRAGDTLTIDGKIWIINSVKDDLGVSVVNLTRRA